MLYRILKPLVLNATHHFFRDIRIKGTAIEAGPLLVVANHPNVVLDGLLVVASYKRPLWFIAKATLFKDGLIGWFLKSVHLIPIYRRQDNPDLMHMNEEAFSAVTAKLTAGEAVLIFPEGDSFATRKIEPLKTGAARIALSAASQSDVSKNLKIQPVGITYSDFFRFNSSATVNVGEALAVSGYTELYSSDPEAAVRELTKRIHGMLSQYTVEVVDVDDARLVDMISKLYQSYSDQLDDHERLSLVREKIARLMPKHAQRLEEIGRRVRLHYQFSRSLKLDGSADMEKPQHKYFMTLVLPFIVLGIFALFVPYRMSYWLSKQLAKRSSQYSSWALSTAFILFPAWVALLGITTWYFSCSLLNGLLVMLLVVGCGIFTSKYFNTFALFIFATMWPSRKSPVDVLRDMRDELIREIEGLEQETAE